MTSTIETATLAAAADLPFTPMPRYLAVACPWCDASVGDRCVTPKGAPRDPHSLRWDAGKFAARTRQFWVLLNEDDERFGLVAGDLLRCVDYPYDAKFTMLFREDDGFEPDCNQYLRDGAFLGFVPFDMEVSLR